MKLRLQDGQTPFATRTRSRSRWLRARVAAALFARADACAVALEWISSILPRAKYDETNWKLWNRLSPHLDEVIAAANELKIEGDVLATILGKFGLWLFYQARYNPAEPLLRRSLSISEKSNGPEHPEVARDLNNLASLFQATNRLEEAEPLMRRDLIILLKFTRSTGHLHPHLKAALGNYWTILEAMSLSEERIARRVAEVGKEAGLDEESYHALVAELSK